MKTVWISRAVGALMMPSDHFGNLGPGKAHRRHDLMSHYGVVGDGAKFFNLGCTNPERDQTFTEHPELRQSVELCQEALEGIRFISPGMLAFIHFQGVRAAGEKIAPSIINPDNFYDASNAAAALPTAY